MAKRQLALSGFFDNAKELRNWFNSEVFGKGWTVIPGSLVLSNHPGHNPPIFQFCIVESETPDKPVVDPIAQIKL